ncbi:MAG: DUF4403 family protein [Chitinispirillales bacterium]|jgi:hypothetical protein|nr:DUF4403 family protein [Chitinispirillales bacterium]
MSRTANIILVLITALANLTAADEPREGTTAGIGFGIESVGDAINEWITQTIFGSEVLAALDSAGISVKSGGRVEVRGAPIGGSGMRYTIPLNVSVTYEALESVGEEALAGQTFRVGLRRARVGGIRITGANSGRVSVNADISGALNGTIRADGKAVYDEEAQTLLIEDINFKIDARSWFSGVRVWFARRAIASKLQAGAKLPIGEQIEAVKTQAQGTLAGGYRLPFGLSMNVWINDIALKNVEVTATGISAVATVGGVITIGR